MKVLRCDCGNRVFFDSTRCGACGAILGFDPVTLKIVTQGPRYKPCANAIHQGLCNWLLPAESTDMYCLACSLNDIIPLLETPGNMQLWVRLESAKRRLLYSLLSLRLPLDGGQAGPPMRFRFMEDRRRNPQVLEEFVSTGHDAGIITININEADDVQRTVEREAMQERYRTLLGHFRHESGHFYFPVLVTNPAVLAEARSLFGDERVDYASRLAAYYRDGPPPDWATRYLSPYASAHPQEDWAESFAHYLLIVDGLETAFEDGLVASKVGEGKAWLTEWMRLSVTLNALARSLGTEDPYPFVLNPEVARKLEFIDRLVNL